MALLRELDTNKKYINIDKQGLGYVQPAHNSLLRYDEGLTLETPALGSLLGGIFISSYHLSNI